MINDSAPSLPPSGGWSGYYMYPAGASKYRMKMILAFSADGRISGDGIDDIAPFRIRVSSILPPIQFFPAQEIFGKTESKVLEQFEAFRQYRTVLSSQQESVS